MKDNHILLKGKNDKSKASRRQQVEKNHKLVMLFGDNLLDFTDPKNLLLKNVRNSYRSMQKILAKVYYFPNQCMEVGNRHFIIINTK